MVKEFRGRLRTPYNQLVYLKVIFEEEKWNRGHKLQVHQKRFPF